ARLPLHPARDRHHRGAGAALPDPDRRDRALGLGLLRADPAIAGARPALARVRGCHPRARRLGPPPDAPPHPSPPALVPGRRAAARRGQAPQSAGSSTIGIRESTHSGSGTDSAHVRQKKSSSSARRPCSTIRRPHLAWWIPPSSARYTVTISAETEACIVMALLQRREV